MAPAAEPRGPSNSSRRLSLVGLVLAIVTLVAAGLAVWDLREDAIANYQEDMANLGVVLREQTTRSFQAVDLVVQETREKVLAAGVETPDQFNRLMATEGIHDFLRERIKNLPQADSVALVSAEGRIVNFSRFWPVPSTDVSDRSYYPYLRDHDDPGVFISEPVKSHTSGAWTIYLVRRVNGPHGEFLGDVTGAIRLRYFEDFYKAIALQDNGSVTVLRRDGMVLARHPITEDQIGKMMPAASPWYARVAADGGTYRSPGYLDGIVRVVSVHPLREYPLVIDVTVSEDAALARWRRQAAFIAIAAACVIIGFAVLFRVLATHVRRIEYSRVQLQRQTAELVAGAAALQESEGRFRDFATTSSDWFWEQDQDLQYTVISDARGTHDMSSPEQRRHIAAIQVTDEQRAAHEADLAARKPFRNFCFERMGGGDIAQHVSISGTPIFDGTGTFRGYRGTGRDRTGEVRAEEALWLAKKEADMAHDRAEKARELAEDASRAKSDFLANMSHEIRTPMNGIIGMTELLLGSPMPPQQTEYAEAIRFSADALLSVINDILDISKLEAGKVELEAIDFDLVDAVESAGSLLAPKAQEKGVELGIFIDPALRTSFRGDPTRLRQILLNLIGNAIKFTEQGSIAVEVSVAPTVPVDGATVVRFEVADTGIGMTAEVCGSLFQKFTQADSSVTRRFGGTGLGLAICRQLVELTGGAIGVSSEIGVGTRCWFEVPLATALTSGVIDARSLPDQLKGLRVLIVDDIAMSRHILGRQLESLHVAAEAVGDGFVGLAALDRAWHRGQPFDLVLLDQMMPGLSGVEFAERVRATANLANVKIVIASSAGGHGLPDQIAAGLVDAMLPKPVRQQALMNCLSRLFGTPVPIETQPARPAMPPSPRLLRVLLAEDNKINEKLAVAILRNAGHDVAVARNGEEAVAAVQEAEYDVVLMDVQMPVLDGVQAMARIRALGPEKRGVPIIALTAHAMTGARETYLAAGMDDYLSKPINAGALLSKLGELAIALKLRTDVMVPVATRPPAVPGDDSVDAFDPTALETLVTIMPRGDLRDFIDLFLGQVEARIARIAVAAAQHDLAAVGREAHAILGCAGNVGMRRLGQLAGALEIACRDGKHDAAGWIAADLSTASLSASEALRAWRDATLRTPAVGSPAEAAP
jgi:signal transduction histidine kinase/DNA-binding response OmpR family regulator/HPt (histidine-containing phosphotransfer) domain-containing protein